jgi:hypothetical protein
MGHQLEQLQAGNPVEGIGSLSEARSREQAMEVELQRQQWDQDLEEAVR